MKKMELHVTSKSTKPIHTLFKPVKTYTLALSQKYAILEVTTNAHTHLLLLHTSDSSAFCGPVIEVVHIFRTVAEHETLASGPHSLRNKQQKDICLKYEV